MLKEKQLVFKERQCVFQDKQSNIVKNDEIQRKIIVFEKGKIFEYSMLMLGLWAKNRNFSVEIRTGDNYLFATCMFFFQVAENSGGFF